MTVQGAHYTLGKMPGPWAKLAACKNHPEPDLWFPGDGLVGGSNHAPAARRICNVCPVREACLEHALAAPEIHGVWGGTSERERRRIRRERAKANRAA